MSTSVAMQSARASPVQTQGASSEASAPSRSAVNLTSASGVSDVPLKEHLGPATGVAASFPPPSGAGRFLLDLCSGATRPLSQAAFRNELACFSVDILLDISHDLLQDVFYESML